MRRRAPARAHPPAPGRRRRRGTAARSTICSARAAAAARAGATAPPPRRQLGELHLSGAGDGAGPATPADAAWLAVVRGRPHLLAAGDVDDA
ncbi:MAG: hypothetical protein HS111_07395 [Kofleriaceae bacterium]|nr:hypothetical protein [Kofleriaceae bacterium]